MKTTPGGQNPKWGNNLVKSLQQTDNQHKPKSTLPQRQLSARTSSRSSDPDPTTDGRSALMGQAEPCHQPVHCTNILPAQQRNAPEKSLPHHFGSLSPAGALSTGRSCHKRRSHSTTESFFKKKFSVLNTFRGGFFHM